MFDGADVPGASAPTRRLVRVVFSPAGVIADDVLRAEVGALPLTQPVVVVTNDQADPHTTCAPPGPTRSAATSSWPSPAAERHRIAHPFVIMRSRWSPTEGVLVHRIDATASSVIVSCDTCVMQGSAHCADCLLTHIVAPAPREEVVSSTRSSYG